MTDILTGTPPELTYLHPFIQQAWMVVWAITSGALAVILGWMGLSFIVQEHLGRHHLPCPWELLSPATEKGTTFSEQRKRPAKWLASKRFSSGPAAE